MSRVRLILALHDHQPVGNFENVFEAAYRDSYLPFLELMEQYPELPFSLHSSGPLMEWLVAHRPEYIERLRAMVAAGRVEILGGGFYEPILTMIPHRDRVGQIRSYSDYLERLFGQPIRGAWIAERVWEQHLVSALVEAGIEFTVLDDFHFQRAGAASDDLFGYYLTEDEGHLLKVFPNSESMRYLVPWQEPHASYEYLRGLSQSRPDAVVVCADDGEKFGGWPDTHEHIFTKGWLRRFCDMIRGNRDWLEPTTFAAVVDSTVPLGKVYLPDCSYREMTEWVLPPTQLSAFEAAVKGSEGVTAVDHVRPFVRAGGFWRNFKNKYIETDEMYARMLELSHRLNTLEESGDADAEALDLARQELYRGQCNCPYWHGAFGGLYLPHLRNAIFKHLIACHDALDRAEGKVGPRVALDVADYNLDARQEARLENDRLIAYVRPASGGHVYELDVRKAGVNVLATLDRRPESYHAAIASAAVAEPSGETFEGPSNLHDRVILKQEGMDKLLVYDRAPRKALVDHFFPIDASLDDLTSCLDIERGDFATGTYLSKAHREEGRIALMMERQGLADGHLIRIHKTIAMEAGRPGLEVVYILEDLPVGQPVHFAIELNLAAMAGHAEDRFVSDLHGNRLGLLDAKLDIPHAEGVNLTDEWLDLGVAMRWSVPSSLWCFPVETASQSEGGFEGIYQSTAVIPHWRITADETRRWTVRLSWSLDLARPEPADAPPEADRPASAPRPSPSPSSRVAGAPVVR
ncbi:alpha-amylase/4-alpha-glucanotransferase domain-containing protein [Tautonia rosea]|uniref:alpha-amylase/4-alpha-glucanotransferase domain-containing protein n=1 Tax=Tautonia rosea TaxID=2728037 RepID=UPI001474CB54|nr:alpha-amylase/4-alpha-glucanotransferase domain-containing protein [Tautonia rosea]